jgi:hypothetical protein
LFAVSTGSLSLAELVIADLLPQSRALLLYGSAARGENGPGSDIDILQVVTTPADAYSRGPVQVAPYTLNRLISMASIGSLFVRHLIDEGKAIVDPDNVLETLNHAYCEASRETRLTQLRLTSGLLDVSDGVYADYWPGLHSCAAFVLRSLAYVFARERGCTSFSMKLVTEVLADPRLTLIQTLRDSITPNRNMYRQILDTIEFYQRSPILNEFGSIEALTVNAGSAEDQTFSWGVRILFKNRARVVYG